MRVEIRDILTRGTGQGSGISTLGVQGRDILTRSTGQGSGISSLGVRGRDQGYPHLGCWAGIRNILTRGMGQGSGMSSLTMMIFIRMTRDKIFNTESQTNIC